MYNLLIAAIKLPSLNNCADVVRIHFTLSRQCHIILQYRPVSASLGLVWHLCHLLIVVVLGCGLCPSGVQGQILVGKREAKLALY